MQDDFRSTGSVKPAPKLTPTLPQNNILEQVVPFETPDQVSQHDEAAPSLAVADSNEAPKPPRGTGHHWFNLPWPPTKREVIFGSIIIAVALIGITGFLVLKKDDVKPAAAVATVKKAAPPASTVVPSTLTGLSVAPEVNQRPVVSAMIENSQAARPQSGLSEAGVIFEAIAEGGITRFLALFQDQQPTNIGPVRSARPYFVQWSEGFRAAYAHIGGSPDALANIKSWNVQDLNQFANSAPFHRVSSRPAPHNMYSSIVELAALATQKGYKSEYNGFERKAAATTKQTTATNIDFTISSALYNSHFGYDTASNTYLRSEGGAPQTDSNNSKQLAPSVVIAIIVPLGQGGRTAQGGAYSNYNPLGTGSAYIFQDGGVTTGNWTKPSNTAQISFTDSAGAAVKLNPGQTWITALSASSKVIYK
ncbi:hypothetical protein BH09PAT3_BH09PAT3_2150 [soil metagenome]